MHSGGEPSALSVTIRFRPLSERERQRGDAIAWYSDDDKLVRNNSNPPLSSYAFDRVFGPLAMTEQVYQVAVRPLVKAAMEGLNGTVFAYGVTGSGKTHTMHGDCHSPGIIPLAIKDAFSIIQDTPGREFLLRVSYLEIYNEVINDLLDPTGQNLRIREDAQGTYVDGIKEVVVISPEHALSFMAAGEERRHVGSNNDFSSLSHTIFTLTIESSTHGDECDGVVFSQLKLIDLAGTESSKTVSTTGLRKKEGSYINKSLLTLRTVIRKLSERKPIHVPYRDSKLTRLLQSSLSGHAHVSLICTITPASSNTEETQNTLKFASMAKRLKIYAASRTKVIDEKSLIKKYQREISVLKQKLEEDANAALVSRVQRLTKLILVCSKNTVPGLTERADEDDTATKMVEEGQIQPEVSLEQIKIREDEDEDLISRLPDCLLVEILSRIKDYGTHYIARTGVLSKRWKNVWTAVPELVFNCFNRPSANFVHFVDKTLTQRRQSMFKSFYLFFTYNLGFESHVRDWIRYAISCNVEVIHLVLMDLERQYIGFMLDQYFCINSYFTDMHLYMCQLKPAGAISWKNLRTLCMACMKLDEDLIEIILSGSPVLETLELTECYGYRRLNITSKSVKKLGFHEHNGRGQDVIEINAPNILSLEIYIHMTLLKRLLINVSSLVKVDLHYFKQGHYETTAKDEERLKGFILNFSHVKELKIGSDCLKVLSRLEAKGFSLPSNLKLCDDYPPLSSDGSEDSDSYEESRDSDGSDDGDSAESNRDSDGSADSDSNDESRDSDGSEDNDSTESKDEELLLRDDGPADADV